MRRQRPTISCRTTLSYDTYLYPNLIHNRLSLLKVMRIHFYCGLSSTEDDGGLQWDLFQDIEFVTQVCGTFISIRLQSFLKSLGYYYKAPALEVLL